MGSTSGRTSRSSDLGLELQLLRIYKSQSTLKKTRVIK